MTHTLPSIPARPEDGHKGTFGTVCVLGGQCAPPRVMLGGPAFSATAALRVGAGLAVLAVPEPLMTSALLAAPAATGIALPVDAEGRLRPSDVAAVLDEHMGGFKCLAVGPGLGAGEAQQQIVIRLIAQDQIPLVLDADGLNALSATADFQGDFRAPAVLTPHPGEFARLARTLNIDRDPTDPSERPAAADELAQRLGCVVVLKGRQTVVANGIDTWTNSTGNVALATAGTGDVLTGMIAGLVAQFFKPHLGLGGSQVTPEQQGGLSLYDCARLGVYMHGLAADRWATEHGHAGLLVTDLLDMLPDTLDELRA